MLATKYLALFAFIFSFLLIPTLSHAQIISGVQWSNYSIQAYNLTSGQYAAPIPKPILSLRGLAVNDAQRIIYFSTYTTLYSVGYDEPRTVVTIANFTNTSGAPISNGGLGFDPTRNKLYGTFGGSLPSDYSRTLYEIDISTGICTFIRDFNVAEFGGMDYDPITDTLYFSNDLSSPYPEIPGRGIYALAAPFATSPLIKLSDYPIKTGTTRENDIDGLAVGNGRLYLCADESQWMYIYNLTTRQFETPVAQTPYGNSDRTGSGAAFAPTYFTGGAYDVSASLSAPPNCTLTTGQPVPFGLTISNTSIRTVSSLHATFTLPTGSSLINSQPTGTLIGNQLTINFGSLAPQASVNATITLAASIPGNLTLSSTVSIAETDATPSNNTPSATVAITPAIPTSATISALLTTIPSASNSRLTDQPTLTITPPLTRPFVSADGSHWIIKLSTDAPAATNQIIAISDSQGLFTAGRQGLFPSVPGSQGPLPPLFFDDSLSINDRGMWAFSGTDGRSTPEEGPHFVARAGPRDNPNSTLIARDRQSVPFQFDTFFAFPRRGCAIDNFDEVWFLSTLSGPAVTLANNLALFSRSGYDIESRTDLTIPSLQIDAAGNNTSFPITSIDLSSLSTGFSVSANEPKIAYGALIAASTTNPNPGGVDRIAVRSDFERGGLLVAVQENTALDFLDLSDIASPNTPFSYARMEPSGVWMAIISTTGPQATNRIAAMDRAVIARSGTPIFNGTTLTWSTQRNPEAFIALCAGPAPTNPESPHPFAIIGHTSAPNPLTDSLILYNNTDILATENDPIDLDGNGIFDDNTFIASFLPHTASITRDSLLCAVTLRSFAASVGCAPDISLGQALITIPLPGATNACPADFNQDGGIDGQDIEAFFITWSVGESPADVNLDGGIDGQDIEFFFLAWETGGC